MEIRFTWSEDPWGNIIIFDNAVDLKGFRDEAFLQGEEAETFRQDVAHLSEPDFLQDYLEEYFL